MENKNMPAFPVEMTVKDDLTLEGAQTGNGRGYAVGVTKREWMAAHVSVANEMENSSIGFIKELMGKEPPSGTMENHAYWNEAEAKLRVMKADALIAELSKS